jgi:hypothetical protein
LGSPIGSFTGTDFDHRSCALRRNGASATNKFTANLLVTSPPDRLSGHVRSRRCSFDGGLFPPPSAQGPLRALFLQSASIKDEATQWIAQPAVMRLYATSCVAPIF